MNNENGMVGIVTYHAYRGVLRDGGTWKNVEVMVFTFMPSFAILEPFGGFGLMPSFIALPKKLCEIFDFLNIIVMICRYTDK